jgi:hypothetical protein
MAEDEFRRRGAAVHRSGQAESVSLGRGIGIALGALGVAERPGIPAAGGLVEVKRPVTRQTDRAGRRSQRTQRVTPFGGNPHIPAESVSTASSSRSSDQSG